MNIHLGSGNRYLSGWVNVDLYGPCADIRADIRTYDVPPGTVSEVFSCHVLEHLERSETEALCRRVFSWLQPGGKLITEMPDSAKCLAMCRNGRAHEGAKGLVGGRGRNKPDWDRWIEREAEQIAETQEKWDSTLHLIPEEFIEPGAQHVYVWSEWNFAEMLRQIGFVVTSEKPQHHGKRAFRDMRVVGVKPCE